MAAGRPAEAIPFLERAVADLPGEATAWNQLGLAYHASGRRPEALKAYLRALNDDRNFFDAHYNLGTLEFEDGHWREAERYLRTYLGLEGNRTNVVAWRMLGDALLSSGQTEAAERALTTALQLAPDQSPVINSLGMALASRRRYKEAQTRFQQAVRVNPQDPASALNLAIVTQQLGDRRSALEHYRRYLSLVSEGPEVAGVRDLVRQLEAQFSPQPALATNRVALTNAVAAASPGTATKGPTNTTGAVRLPATNPAVALRPSVPDRTTNVSPAAAKPGIPLVAALTTNGSGTRGATNLAVPPATPVRPPEPSVPVEIVRVEDAPALRAARDPGPPAAVRTQPAPAATTSERPSASGPGTVGSPPAPASAAAPEPGLSGTNAVASAERKTFWQRVSPVNWGNPVKWFREDPETSGTNALATRAAEAKIARANGPSAGPSTNRSVPSSSRVAAPSPAAPQATQEPPPKPVVPRYLPRETPSVAPGDRAAAEVMARQAENTLDRDAALAAWQRTVQLDPSWTAAWMQTGRLALEASNSPVALRAGEAATALDPSSAGARQLFAASLARAGFPKDAADQLEKATTLAPGNAQLHLALAGLYARDLGEAGLARPHYEQVLTLEPKNPQAGAIRVWLANNP